MELHVYKDADETCLALAAWIASLIVKTLQVKEKFTWALAGGETPRKLYEILSTAPWNEKIKWDRVHIFWGDERVVPFSDEKSNAKMAWDALLGKVNIPEKNIHKMWTDIDPEESARQYEKLLHTYFDDKLTTFDLVLCGIGEDGHTLSLFPGENIGEGWVAAVHSKEKGERITLLPAVVNRAAAVAFFVTGQKKAAVLQKILETPLQPEFPAQLIAPENRQLHWFVDEEAVGG
jgi:6-phosphogluconolactonase